MPEEKEQSIGGLWKSDKGDWMSGKITVDGVEVKIICFTNKYKTAESNQPDFRIFIKSRPKGETPSADELEAF